MFRSRPWLGLPAAYLEVLWVYTLLLLTYEAYRNGLLPWRFVEFYGMLRRSFEGFRRQVGYAATDLILFSATAAHYIQDAHQPFHGTDNYDGQQTGQRGIHARFETALVERFQSRLMLVPGPAKPITDPRDVSFHVLLDSYQLVDGILQADKNASAGKEIYDDDYYEKFFAAVKPVLDRRISEAISATASLIIGAWEAAGRPAVPLQEPRPVEKVIR